MEIKQLRQFMAVVDAGTVSAASMQLHLTQPALTRNIKKLEESVGALLLTREPRGVVATEAGRTLYRYAHVILNEAKRAARDVTAISTGKKGHVHIGIAALFASTIVHDLVIALQDCCPGVRIRITEGFFEELFDELNRRKLDLILSNVPPNAVSAELHFEPLVTLRSNFVVGRRHPLSRKTNVTTEDLCSAQWAIVRRPHVADFLESFLPSQASVALCGAVETNSLTALKALVLTGRFISVLAEPWVSDEISSGEMVALRVPGAPILREAGLLTHGAAEQRPVVLTVLQLVRQVCASRYQDYVAATPTALKDASSTAIPRSTRRISSPTDLPSRRTRRPSELDAAITS